MGWQSTAAVWVLVRQRSVTPKAAGRAGAHRLPLARAPTGYSRCPLWHPSGAGSCRSTSVVDAGAIALPAIGRCDSGAQGCLSGLLARAWAQSAPELAQGVSQRAVRPCAFPWDLRALTQS